MNERVTWIGPFTFDQIIRGALDPSFPRPPESDSAYVVTVKPWRAVPSRHSEPLYVGGNTSASARFRTRIGDLLADLLGLFTDTTGHSSGGQSLHRYCRETGTDPLALYIAWAADVSCGRCLESHLYKQLFPRLNKVAPARCKAHP